MKKLYLFSITAGLTLVSAAPPPPTTLGYSEEVGRGYPECSRLVTDRCIQLYEHGVRASADAKKFSALATSAGIVFRHSQEPRLKRELFLGSAATLAALRATEDSTLDPAWEAQQVRRMREGGYLIVPTAESPKRLASRSRPSSRCS
jgi:hypothetical protein